MADLNKLLEVIKTRIARKMIKKASTFLFAQKMLVGRFSETVAAKSALIPRDGDLFRYATLSCIANEVREFKVEGAIAEAGVYRGTFSRIMRHLLPERDLYLFDTFSGFDKAQVEHDSSNFGLNVPSDRFVDCSEEAVLKYVDDIGPCDNKGDVIVRKGFFPETAKDIDRSFALVSLDMDLYQPIYDGLEFFYPKISRGGYIMIHDCRAQKYFGAGEAARKYCKEHAIPFVPLGDNSTSYVIAK